MDSLRMRFATATSCSSTSTRNSSWIGACRDAGGDTLTRLADANVLPKANDTQAGLRAVLTERELVGWPRTEKSGALSTAYADLRRGVQHPVIAALARNARVRQLLTTFGPTFQRHILPSTDRVHEGGHRTPLWAIPTFRPDMTIRDYSSSPAQFPHRCDRRFCKPSPRRSRRAARSDPAPSTASGPSYRNDSLSNCQPWPSANRDAMGGQNEAGEGLFGWVDRRSDCHPLSRVSY
jgi:hypothetical protein